MMPFDLSKISWNDFLANGVFFVADIALLSILLPLLIRFSDNRKWSAARRKIGERSAAYMDRLNYQFESFADLVSGVHGVMPEVVKDDPAAYTEEGLTRQRSAIFKAYWDELPRFRDDVDKVVNEYLQEMQLLAPAFDSKLAILSVKFYEAAIRPRSIAFASLYWWAALGPEEDPSKISINREASEEIYLKCESALECLCEASGLKTQRIDEQLIVLMAKPTKPSELSRYYPHHAPIFQTMERLAKVLTVPLPPTIDHQKSAHSE